MMLLLGFFIPSAHPAEFSTRQFSDFSDFFVFFFFFGEQTCFVVNFKKISVHYF